jgi:hypothetical protein
MFDDKAADVLQTGQSGDVTFTAGDHVTPMARVQAAEQGPASQILHVISYIIIGRAPPL